jgi:hypothetical protein
MQGNRPGQVAISNFNIIPRQIYPGEEFKIGVSVTNNLNVPITYQGDQCGGSPFNIEFDKNVNAYNAITCQAISTETLDPHQSVTVEGKGHEILSNQSR